MNISISFLVTCTLSATAIKSIDSADMQLCKQDGVLSLVTIFCALTLSQGSTVVYHGCCKYLCKLFTFSVKLPWLPLCRIHFCNVVRPCSDSGPGGVQSAAGGVVCEQVDPEPRRPCRARVRESPQTCRPPDTTRHSTT